MFGSARTIGFIPLATATLAIAAFFLSDQALHRGDLAGPPIAWIALGLLVALLLALAVRSLFLRIDVSETSIYIRQWFRTTVVSIDEVTAIAAIDYRGLMNQGGLWDFGLGMLMPMVVVEGMRDKELVILELPATLAPIWRIDRKTMVLRDLIEARSGREISDHLSFPGLEREDDGL